MPTGWNVVSWRSTSSAKSRCRERIWFSPHCLSSQQQRALFEVYA